MRRCLIVANQSLNAERLHEALQERIRQATSTGTERVEPAERTDATAHSDPGEPTSSENRTPAAEAPVAAAADLAFFVVVPATPLRDQVVGPGRDEGEGSLLRSERSFALAQQRLDNAVAQIESFGVPVDGEVGPADVLEATRLALSRFAADEIIVSTLPSGLSRWLRADIPSKIGRSFHVPVTHIEAEAHGH